MRRADSAFCRYTEWPRVYKPYNSTVRMTLYEESKLQGLPCFWYSVCNGGMRSQNFTPYLCEINDLNINVTCILILREHLRIFRSNIEVILSLIGEYIKFSSRVDESCTNIAAILLNRGNIGETYLYIRLVSINLVWILLQYYNNR